MTLSVQVKREMRNMIDRWNQQLDDSLPWRARLPYLANADVETVYYSKSAQHYIYQSIRYIYEKHTMTAKVGFNSSILHFYYSKVMEFTLNMIEAGNKLREDALNKMASVLPDKSTQQRIEMLFSKDSRDYSEIANEYRIGITLTAEAITASANYFQLLLDNGLIVMTKDNCDFDEFFTLRREYRIHFQEQLSPSQTAMMIANIICDRAGEEKIDYYIPEIAYKLYDELCKKELKDVKRLEDITFNLDDFIRERFYEFNATEHPYTFCNKDGVKKYVEGMVNDNLNDIPEGLVKIEHSGNELKKQTSKKRTTDDRKHNDERNETASRIKTFILPICKNYPVVTAVYDSLLADERIFNELNGRKGRISKQFGFSVKKVLVLMRRIRDEFIGKDNLKDTTIIETIITDANNLTKLYDSELNKNLRAYMTAKHFDELKSKENVLRIIKEMQAQRRTHDSPT